MVKRLFSILAVWFFVAGAGSMAWAELESVSGIDNTEVFANGDPANVALFPPGGPGANFPLWYKDTNGLKLTLCLQGEEGGAPCHWEGAPVFIDPGCNIHFYDYENVVGFGNEGFYYKVQSYPFDVPLGIGGSAQLQYLVETTWGADTRFDPITGQVEGQDIYLLDEAGQCVSSVGSDLHRVEPGFETLFSRLRLRLLDTAPAGWYRMTHPYGVKTIFRQQADVDETRRTEVRQLVGDLLIPDPDNGWTTPLEQNYVIAINDPYVLIDGTNPDPFNHPYIGLRDTGFINDGDFTDPTERLQLKAIGPYLYKPDYLTDPTLQIADENGVVQQFLGRVPDEVNPAASPGHPVAGSAFVDPLFPEEGFVNFFKIRFLAGVEANPPSDAEWESAPVVGETAEFNVIGKVFAEKKLLQPNGGELLTVGDVVTVEWTVFPGAAFYRLRYSVDGGTNWLFIDRVDGATSYQWTVPNEDSANVLFRVTAHGAGGGFLDRDESDAPFSIALPASTLLQPNGGEILTPGQVYSVLWTDFPDAAFYRLRYSVDGGTNWFFIDRVDGATSYQWTVPNEDSANVLFRVTAHGAGGGFLDRDESDAPFSIALPASTLLQPNGGEVLSAGAVYNVQWTDFPNAAFYRLRYSVDGGTNWIFVDRVDGATSYQWTVPNEDSASVVFRVTAHGAGGGFLDRDESDAPFTIAP